MKRLAFLGDSITAGADWNALLGRTDCLNFGHPGDATWTLAGRQADIYNSGAEVCFIMAGVNDFTYAPTTPNTSGHTLIDIAGNMRTNSNILPVLIAPFKVGTADANYANKNAFLTTIQNYLNSQAPGNIMDYLSINDVWMAPTGVLKPEYTTDGTHLTAAGYAKWAWLLNYWLTKHGY